MSNLIVPTNYQNPLLEANLKAFFKRYPYERSRLEHLLSKPVDNRPVVTIDVPACPSKPPMRVLILAGIPSPTFLADILNDPVVQEQCFEVFIVENNIDNLAFCFQYSDLTQIIAYPKTEWFLMNSIELLKPAFFRVMKQEHVASLMKNVHILESNLEKDPAVVEFYKSIPDAYNETVFHVFHNFGRINDSLDGVRATLMNKDAVLKYPGIEDLKGAFKGTPALIVGAGPSLDKELDNIKKNNDKFVVICADAALKPLLKAGIRVDYCTSIERLNNYQKPFFEGIEGEVTTELVAFPVVLPSQFALYPGKIRLVYRNYSYFAYFERSWPKGILKCGGSTSHLAVRLADWFGCSKIVLVGIDSTYEKSETGDLYRSHCSNSGHVEWSQWVTLDTFTKDRKHLPPIVGISNEDKEVMTNMTYYQWAKEFTEELSEVGARMPIINTSLSGLKIEGIEYLAFDSLASNLDEKGVTKPVQPGTRFDRTFDHKVIVRNFEAWQKLVDDCITESNKLIEQDQVDVDRYEALTFIYNFRFIIDSLFIAFVIQCCAKEFFELENEFWALDKRHDADIKEKVIVTKKRLELVKSVLDQLVPIFKEVGNGQQVYKQSDD